MIILDTKLDLKANSRLLLHDYRDYFHWVILTAVLDVASTIWFMKLIGPQIESNLIVRLMAYAFGIVLGPIIGKTSQLFAVWSLTLLAPRLTKMLCVLIIFLNLMACLLNTLLVVNNIPRS